MTGVLELGFRAFDPHELLPYSVAARSELFADAGLDVRLRDLTFGPDDLPQVSCGAALLARFRNAPVRIVLVASRHPLFWLVRRPGATEEIRRIASYPSGSPPALFARIAVAAAEQVPARDDDARLGLLLAGDVDCALVSSSVDPASLDGIGLARVLALSDVLTVPTTGLAVPEALVGDTAIETLAAVLRRALELIHDDHDLVARTLVERFRYSPSSAWASAHDYARSFSVDGAIDRDEAAAAIGTVAEALAERALAAEEVYAPGALR